MDTFADDQVYIEPSSGLISHSDPWWKTILSGYSTGIIFVITGYPFDTVKLRLQTNTRHNLFRHLYRGVLSVLLTTPPSWSINFVVY